MSQSHEIRYNQKNNDLTSLSIQNNNGENPLILMNNNLSVFSFENSEVRFVDGMPVANDVATVLGYADPKSTIRDVVDNDYKTLVNKSEIDGGKSTTPLDSQITVLLEPGIYQLIFGSKLESAKKFQRWVFEDVLPSIRQSGQYSIEQKVTSLMSTSQQCFETLEQQIKVLADQKEVLLTQILGTESVPTMEDIARLELDITDYFSVDLYLDKRNLNYPEEDRIKLRKTCKWLCQKSRQFILYYIINNGSEIFYQYPTDVIERALIIFEQSKNTSN